MDMYTPLIYLFAVISWLFWPVVIGTIIYMVVRKKKKAGASVSNGQKVSSSELSIDIMDSKEDTVSQFFFLLAFSFFGVALFTINRDLGDPIPWNLIVLFTSLVGLIGAYALQSILVLPFAIGSFVSWWAYQMFKVAETSHFKVSAIVATLLMLPVLFYVLGHFHALQKKYVRFGSLYKIVGILFTTMVLFMLSTQSGVQMLEAATNGNPITTSWQAMLSLATISLVTIGLGRYSLYKKKLSIYEYFAVILLTCLFVGIALLPEQNVYTSSLTNLANIGRGNVVYTGRGELNGLGIFWVALFNLAIFVELLGLIFSGYVRHEEWLINTGALFLFLLIVAKYFDWFFTFLDKSIFFIGAGILLFALGWFMERGRRYMIANVKAGHTPQL